MRVKPILLLMLVAGSSELRGAPIAQAEAALSPPAYQEAVERLAAGDTVRALELLQRATEEAPDFGPAHLRIGAILSAAAGELESEHDLRREAEESLLQAWELMGNDPEVMLEYGLLLRRQRIVTDAKRVLERAWKAAERKGAEMPAAERARLHYLLGLIYETWWEDWQELVIVPRTTVQLDCSAVRQPEADPESAAAGRTYPHWDRAVLCPEQWWEQSEHVVRLADLKSDERDRMVQHFRLALGADSTHVDAAIRLLGHLADADAWGEYLKIARQLARQVPDDPRPLLFYALGLHEQGYGSAADSTFDQALVLLTMAERRAFADISPLLRAKGREFYTSLDSAGRRTAANAFFASTDPLFLTEVEERRLEHYARLAWAELKFSDPKRGLRGWDSERGRVWVRYGRPLRWYQCCYGSAFAFATGIGAGGRVVYWSYGPEGPVFVFARSLTYRRALLTEASKFIADDLSEIAPELYRPTSVTTTHAMPLQLVRFRGNRPDLTRVEIYAEAPLDSLGTEVGGVVETGLFVFDRNYRELLARRLAAQVEQPRLGLTYGFEVPSGQYNFGIEARRDGPENLARPAARVRDTLTVAGFPSGELTVSDLLLADALRPLVGSPTRRDELRIWPSRTLRFASGAPIHVYFEIYGLAADPEGLAQYRVEFAVEDAERRNLVQRLARGLQELFSRSGQDEPRVSWERVAPLSEDSVMDYVSVTLPPLGPGEYRVALRITDLANGRTAASERTFLVLGSP